jgi:hypothetical protein
MAIVKLKYLTKRPQLKRHLRYITHRRGREPGSLTRKLFGSNGLTDKQAVYSLIDTARRGTVFYKFMINPDPSKEDTCKDLDLEHITRQTILALERQLGLNLPFAAVLHPADHTPLRHVHGIFLLPRRLSQVAFRQLQKTAWTTATTQARLQRRARDKVLANPRYRSFFPSLLHRRYPKRLQPDRGRQTGAVARHVAAGTRLPRVQSGCRVCGFGLTAGISAFLPVCPRCGKGLSKVRAAQLTREVSL